MSKTVDTNELAGMRSLVFVANQQSNTVSVFDDAQNTLIGNITLRGEPPYSSPHSISLDSVTNRAYVTSPRSNVISIIDYSVNQVNETATLTWNLIKEVRSQLGPQHIAVDSDNSLAFVSNSLTNTISVIDSKDLPEVKSTVRLADFFPGSLVYDEHNEALYVSSLKDNSISIVQFDSEGNEEYQNRTEIDSVVYDIAYNPQTRIIYLANHDAKTVSTVNAASKKPAVIATFYMNPSNTTDTTVDRISCEGKPDPVDLGIPVRLDNGTKCTPIIDESGFIFESWVVEGEHSLSDTNISSANSGIANDNNFASALPLLDNNLDGKQFDDSVMQVTSYGTYTVNLERRLDVLQSSVGFISVGILIVVSILTALLYKHIPRVFSGLAKLEVATIIQVDSSAIFGILILLSLSATGGNSPFGSNAPQLWITTLIVIIPFALSSILVMAREKYKGLGTGFMLAGFVILSTSISLIVASALGPSLSAGIGPIFK
jgi:YVTN family beta-propeller protein